jgi:nascent polypeptide-associated complex subunit beta
MTRRTGGAKAPIRRKVAVKAQAPVDDKKLQTALKKLNVQPLPGVEEVNMFKEDGVLHFNHPRGQSHLSSPSSPPSH